MGSVVAICVCARGLGRRSMDSRSLHEELAEAYRTRHKYPGSLNEYITWLWEIIEEYEAEEAANG